MVPFIILTPLILSGCAVVLLREHQQRKSRRLLHEIDKSKQIDVLTGQTFNQAMLVDYVTEIKHYQKISWFTLGLSSFIALLYPPLYLASIPLLSYDIFYLFKTIARSENHKTRPITTLLETLSVGGSFITGRLVMCSFFLTVLFAMRKMRLQIGNVVHIGLPDTFNPKMTKVWILRNEFEVETHLYELQKDDILVVHAGERIFLNGVVVGGEGQVEQYSLANRTQIISKQPGDWVFAFSWVESGFLHIRCS